MRALLTEKILKEWFAFHFSYKPKFDKPCLYTILVVFDVQEPKGIK
jgi:hypothetical protein